MVRVGGRVLRIASRGSELALWQANAVREKLLRANQSIDAEVDVVRTVGDVITDVPLSRIGDRGLFTKEIDGALLDGRADLAVHSLKDVPTTLPEGLVLAAVTERADPRDVLLCRSGVPPAIEELAPGARVGTSSLRRRAQLRARRPDLDIVDLRGNLNTRLARLDGGDYEAIILAAAGVERLGWRERISAWLDPPAWLPAVGQGALAVVIRAGDEALLRLLHPLHHDATGRCVAAERAFLHALEGGCQVPIGALGSEDGESLHLEGLVADLDGRVIRARLDDSTATPERLGTALARVLLDRGAGELLATVRDAASTPPIPPP